MEPTASAAGAAVGVLAALPEELGHLPALLPERRVSLGLELCAGELGGVPALACVSGIGKVRAARAAAALQAAGATRALLVVGVCGGLRRSVPPGTLVHCTRAVQADLAVRDDRECAADASLLAAWREEAPGTRGWFLTADRPVLTPWRRLRLARAFAGPCVADMETAAAAGVARAAGLPWAALRAVTDGAGSGAVLAFRRNYAVQAPRAADSVPGLLARIAGSGKRGEGRP